MFFVSLFILCYLSGELMYHGFLGSNIFLRDLFIWSKNNLCQPTDLELSHAYTNTKKYIWGKTIDWITKIWANQAIMQSNKSFKCNWYKL